MADAALKRAAGGAVRGDAPDDEQALEDLRPVLDIVDRYRGVADTVRRASQHAAKAAACIAPFREGRAKSDLLSAGRFAVERDR